MAKRSAGAPSPYGMPLASSVRGRVQGIRRSLSPWVRGRLRSRRASGSVDRGRTITFVRTGRLVKRVQRVVDRSVVWRPDIGSLEPAMVARFSDRIVNRFPSIADKYRVQSSDAGPEDGLEMPLPGGRSSPEPADPTRRSSSLPTWPTTSRQSQPGPKHEAQRSPAARRPQPRPRPRPTQPPEPEPPAAPKPKQLRHFSQVEEVSTPDEVSSPEAPAESTSDSLSEGRSPAQARFDEQPLMPASEEGRADDRSAGPEAAPSSAGERLADTGGVPEDQREVVERSASRPDPAPDFTPASDASVRPAEGSAIELADAEAAEESASLESTEKTPPRPADDGEQPGPAAPSSPEESSYSEEGVGEEGSSATEPELDAGRESARRQSDEGSTEAGQQTRTSTRRHIGPENVPPLSTSRPPLGTGEDVSPLSASQPPAGAGHPSVDRLQAPERGESEASLGRRGASPAEPETLPPDHPGADEPEISPAGRPQLRRSPDQGEREPGPRAQRAPSEESWPSERPIEAAESSVGGEISSRAEEAAQAADWAPDEAVDGPPDGATDDLADETTDGTADAATPVAPVEPAPARPPGRAGANEDISRRSMARDMPLVGRESAPSHQQSGAEDVEPGPIARTPPDTPSRAVVRRDVAETELDLGEGSSPKETPSSDSPGPAVSESPGERVESPSVESQPVPPAVESETGQPETGRPEDARSQAEARPTISSLHSPSDVVLNRVYDPAQTRQKERTGSRLPLTHEVVTDYLEAKGYRFKRKPAAPAEDRPDRVARATQDLERSAGTGRPLDEAPRTLMEGALGRDFSDVRVHQADLGPLNVQAASRGRDVYVEPGQDRFDTPESLGVLGHELAHVAQRGGGRTVSAKPDEEASSPAATSLPLAQRSSQSTREEAEADEAERLVMRALDAPSPGPPGSEDAEAVEEGEEEGDTDLEEAALSPDELAGSPILFLRQEVALLAAAQLMAADEEYPPTLYANLLQIAPPDLDDIADEGVITEDAVESIEEMAALLETIDDLDLGEEQAEFLPDLDQLARQVYPLVKRMMALERERRIL